MPKTTKLEPKSPQTSQETPETKQKPLTIDEIAARAEAETARIAEKLAQVEAQITAAQQELDAIPLARAERTERLSTAQRQVTTLAATHTEATTYARIADGNQDAIRAVSAAAQDLDQARQELAQIAREAELAERRAQQREQELTAQLAQLREEHGIHHADLRNVEVIRDRTFTELGQAHYDEIMASYEQGQALIENLRTQLVAMQVKQAEQLDQAEETLKPWPALVHKLRLMRGYQDATTRVIDAAISYLECLLHERKDLKQDLPGLESTKGMYYWWKWLEIPANEMFGHTQHIKGNVSYLEDRLRQLKQLRTEYTAQMLG